MNIEMFLAITFTGASLALSIYLGTVILNFFKLPNHAVQTTHDIARRKIVSKPTLTCELPIHQQARHEAPLY